MPHTLREKTKILSRTNRIKGQLEALASAVENEQECYQIMLLLASCRGAINGLMSDIVEAHIRNHIVEVGNRKKASEAGEELIDVIKSFIK